jgi:hypothetical protein
MSEQHQDEPDRQPEREPVKHPANDAGQSWAEVAQAARRRSPNTREATERMLRAFGGEDDE